ADAAAHPAESYEAEGINVFFGAPQFLDNHTIKLNDRLISSKRFVVCPGSHPVVPSIEGLDKIPYLTNETIFEAEVLPKSMIVLGAGPIGIELAAALNRLGVNVTVLLRSPRILKKEDEELSERLMQILRAEGVTILTKTNTTAFTQGKGKIIADIEDAQGKRRLEAESVLVAVGRSPNLEGLALEKAGVDFDSQGINVDRNLRTTARNIYACGDVVPPYLFTHMAEYEAIIATTNACFGLPIRKTNYENALWCTYTDPELAHAGLTESQARHKHGDKIRVYRWEHKDVDRAKTDLVTDGLSKFICDKKGRLLGIHILGHGAAELMHEAQFAKSLGLPFSKIASVIHAYPSYSDAVRQPAKRCYIDILQDNFFLKLLRNLSKKQNRKWLILLVALAALILALLLLPVKEWLISVLEWTQGLGYWGPVFVAAFYVAACIFFLPGSVLTLGAGFLFKVLIGVITVSIGSTLGACAAFLVGRTIARGWISKKVAANQKFAAIDDAVGRQGFKIVLLTRLSPVFPFNLLNYAFGLTKVSFWKYALASWIGMIPGTLMYVYFGAGLRSLADVAAGKVQTGLAGKIFFWFGMAATVVVTVFVTRIARKALKDAVRSD
ncbi:MAG: FAD-dependent oxidoreductase, partial [Planctomycetota bacterium]